MGSIRAKNGVWINSLLFSETAKHFQTYGRYTDALYGTLEYDQFWDREWDRCVNGYSVGGSRITGKHYFYLNFCPIKRLDDSPNEKISKNKSARRSKKMDFPDFWDGDYNFFYFKDIADFGLENDLMPYLEKELFLDYPVLDKNGAKFLAVTKRRRAGFSYKLGSIAAHKYTFTRNSLTLLCAFDKKYLYPKGIFSMCDYYLNFLNTYTDFGKQRLINKTADGYIKSGFIKEENGIEVTKGFLSEVMSLTFNNNPDAARGKDADEVIVEEIGTFSNWKDTYYSLEPCVREGDFVTGSLCAFGTGDTEDNIGIKDFEEMFYSPKQFNMLPFKNVWDEDKFGTECCFFFPAYQNYLGEKKDDKQITQSTVDKQGNSNKELAKELLDKRRDDVKREAKAHKDFIKHTTEWPKTPAESFQQVGGNNFPTHDLKKQLAIVQNDEKLHGKCGMLHINEFGRLEFDVDPHAIPLYYDTQKKVYDKSGTMQIWEDPVVTAPWESYIGSLDPYAEDQAENSVSLGSMMIFKRYIVGEEVFDCLVAEYTGRPDNYKEFYDNCILLLEYYNAKCLYENNINNFKDHCQTKHKLYLLYHTPSLLKSTSNQNKNNYGIRVVGNAYSSVKRELETYTNQFLRSAAEDGISNVYKIKSIGLLQELIRYTSDGNYDRVIAFMLVLVKHIELNVTPMTYNNSQDNTTGHLFKQRLFS